MKSSALFYNYYFILFLSSCSYANISQADVCPAEAAELKTFRHDLKVMFSWLAPIELLADHVAGDGTGWSGVAGSTLP